MKETIMPSWLKAGLACTTRDGRKVRILATDLQASDNEPVVGAIQHSKGVEGLGTFSTKGAYIGQQSPCGTDLVGPWVEPLPELKVGMRVKLRNHMTGRIICTDRAHTKQPVVGLVDDTDGPDDEIETWCPNGRWSLGDSTHTYDIVEVLP